MSWVAVGVAAAGMLAANQKQKQQQANANSQRKLAAETARYSPWTGMTPGQVNEPENSAFGATLGGGLAGYSMGRSFTGGGMGGKPQPTDQAAMSSNTADQFGDKKMMMNSQYRNDMDPYAQKSPWK